MTVLPYPNEPTEAVLRKYGNSYDKGIQDFFGIEKTKDELVVKQAMIGYLWNYWKDYDLTRNDVAAACGSANFLIEMWFDDKREWDEVVDQIQSSLDVDLE